MPYILNTDKDRELMLKAIGVKTADELFSAIPSDIRCNDKFLGEGKSEFEVARIMNKFASRDVTVKSKNSFLGAGWYDHYVPALVGDILSKPEFLTAYTPYQPECSQGILQAIYEFQTYMSILTGMDISNASLLDGGSAVAEAALMAIRVTKRQKIYICRDVNPQYRQVLDTYLHGSSCTITEIVDVNAITDEINNDGACLIFQTPNFFGVINDYATIIEKCKKLGVITVNVVNPIALGILRAPGDYGVDMVCGEGQPLGAGMNYGGPGFGFLTAKRQYARQMPGRIVGKTLDSDGQTAYCLTLQTREQHIRREKATSNICSNQSLNAIGAAVYLAIMGSSGLKDVARLSFGRAHYLYDKFRNISEIVTPFSGEFFNEFVWKCDNASIICDKLNARGIAAGYLLEKNYPEYKNCILTCCTETKSESDIDEFINEIDEVMNG